MIRTKQQRRRDRRRPDPAVAPTVATSHVISAALAGTDVAYTVDPTIMLTGLPLTWTVAGHPPVAIVSNTGSVVTLRYAAHAVVDDPWIAGAYDPNARTTTGGYYLGNVGTL